MVFCIQMKNLSVSFSGNIYFCPDYFSSTFIQVSTSKPSVIKDTTITEAYW